MISTEGISLSNHYNMKKIISQTIFEDPLYFCFYTLLRMLLGLDGDHVYPTLYPSPTHTSDG